MTCLAQPKPRPWKLLLPSGLALILSLAGNLTIYTALPAYAPALGVGMAALGVLLSANRLVRLIANPVMGYLTDRIGHQNMFLSGLALGAFSTLFYILARGFWLLLLGRLLWGIAWSILYIGLYCLLLDHTDRQDWGWGSGSIQTFYFIGLAVTPVLGGFLSDRLGFTRAMLVCMIIQAAGFVFAFLFLPHRQAVPAKVQEKQKSKFSFRSIRISGISIPRGWFAKNRAILTANYLYLLTLFIGDGFILSTVTLFLKQRYGASITLGWILLPVVTASGILLALRSVISALAAPLTGRWSDKSGRYWTISAWATFATILGCLLLAVRAGWGLILGGIGLVSFGGGALMTLLPVIVKKASGDEHSGLAIGVLTTSGDIGCALAPLISYALLGVLSFEQLYLVSAVLMASGFIWIVCNNRM